MSYNKVHNNLKLTMHALEDMRYYLERADAIDENDDIDTKYYCEKKTSQTLTEIEKLVRKMRVDFNDALGR